MQSRLGRWPTALQRPQLRPWAALQAPCQLVLQRCALHLKLGAGRARRRLRRRRRQVQQPPSQAPCRPPPPPLLLAAAAAPHPLMPWPVNSLRACALRLQACTPSGQGCWVWSRTHRPRLHLQLWTKSSPAAPPWLLVLPLLAPLPQMHWPVMAVSALSIVWSLQPAMAPPQLLMQPRARLARLLQTARQLPRLRCSLQQLQRSAHTQLPLQLSAPQLQQTRAPRVSAL